MVRNTNHGNDYRSGRTLLFMRSALIISMITVLLLSCSFDYQQKDESTEDLSPDYRLVNTSYIVSRESADRISFTADRAAFYDEEARARLEGVRFTQTDSSEEVLSEGTCREAIISTDSHDAELEGDIIITSHIEEIIVKTEHLYWDQEQNLLTSPEEVPVEVIYADGSHVRGTGFRADALLRSIEFSSSTEGFVYE